MALEGILVNLISDVLFVLIVIALGWLLYRVSRRAQLLKFFGINKSRRIAVYLSNLRIREGGAIGIDGQARSYEGSAAAFGELVVANGFRDLFNYFLPSLSDSPGLLSRLLISDVQVQLLHSPLNSAQIEQTASLVTLGSSAYNTASELAENQLHAKARFELVTADPTEGLQVRPVPPRDINDVHTGPTGTFAGGTLNFPSSGSLKNVDLQPPISPSGIITQSWQIPGSPITPPSMPQIRQIPAILVDGVAPMTDSTYGLVERITDHDNKRFVFYAAGISELATAGAAHFLISEWARLYRKYGTDNDFLIILGIELHDYRRWAIAFEK